MGNALGLHQLQIQFSEIITTQALRLEPCIGLQRVLAFLLLDVLLFAVFVHACIYVG